MIKVPGTTSSKTNTKKGERLVIWYAGHAPNAWSPSLLPPRASQPAPLGS